MTIEDAFEYLTFGGTFSRSFSIWLDRFDFFTSIAGLVLIPFVVLNVSLAILIGVWAFETTEIPDFHPKHIPLVIFIFGLQFATYYLATVIGRGAIILGVARMYVGQRATMMECLKDTWAKKWTLISVFLIMGSAMLLGGGILLLFIAMALEYPNPLTIFLAVLISIVVGAAGWYGYIGIILTNPSVMVENFQGPVEGMKRSWELSTGSRCYILCTLFCLWFMNSMISQLLQNLFGGENLMETLFSAAGLVVSVLPLLIYFPLHSIMETVMYLNLRIGRESMNHQVLSGDLMSNGASSLSRRFRHDDFDEPSTTIADYRHIPLMDEDDLTMTREVA